MRLRLGITLWILSWVPWGLILNLSGAWLTVAWTVEILLGITGLAIAGTQFAQAVKDEGWKGAPTVAWHALVRGKDIEAPNQSVTTSTACGTTGGQKRRS
jgi:hypothetical protein